MIKNLSAILLAAVCFTACGDDPKPTPGPSSSGRQSGSQTATSWAGPGLDAIRDGQNWRLTLTLPAGLPEGFSAATAIIQSATGEELARQPWEGEHMTFTVAAQGEVTGLVLGAAGERLQSSLRLQ